MDRRLFLATTVSTGVMAATHMTAHTASAAETFSVRGLTKSNIPTPALLVDLDALEANLQKMAKHAKQAKVGLRPHAKTHKCPEIARRQIAAGAIGICCATVPELEALAAAGIPGLLLTSPIVDPGKITRVAALASGGAKIMLSVGHIREAELLAEAADAAKVNLDVLVDLDVGDKRTGCLPGEPAVELARQIARFKRLTIRGVQAYAGHASHTVGFEAAAFRTPCLRLKPSLLENLDRCQILSGGSTGTYNIDSAVEGVTELQAGSYVFMDVDYRRIGGKDGNATYLDFQPSLTILATVVSATHAGRVTIDAGTKAVDTTTANLPQAKNFPGLTYAKAGDEFGALTQRFRSKLPALGERLELIVPHCDPSVNLYDRLYACRGETVEEIWPVAARREFSGTKA
jgi:D-serine deaminase-like pyridoxal phosphate-dependent protein